MTITTLVSLTAPPPEELSVAQTAELAPPAKTPACFTACADPNGMGAEQYRRLAVSLLHRRASRPLQTVLLSSAAPGEGKSVSAANLAYTLARPGRERVLLLEGDLHRPAVLARMGVRQESGLADWLERRRPLTQCMGRWKGLPLWILPAGRARGVPLELLQAHAPAFILRLLKPHFDWIIVDAPPLLPMADAVHWAQAVDGVVLVVRAQHTRISDVQLAVRQLERDKWLGSVWNGCEAREHRYYRQYYPGGK